MGLLVVGIIAMITPAHSLDGVWCALFAGLFLDAFSSFPFGMFTAACILGACAIKFVKAKYVRAPLLTSS